MANSFGIDIGTQNLKVFSGSNNQITNIKNTIAIVNKNQMYSYGDSAYSMYEKAPETINVSFPIVSVALGISQEAVLLLLCTVQFVEPEKFILFSE